MLSKKKLALAFLVLAVAAAAAGVWFWGQQSNPAQLLPKMAEDQQFVALGVDDATLWSRKGKQVAEWYVSKGGAVPSFVMEALSRYQDKSSLIKKAGVLLYQDEGGRVRWYAAISPSADLLKNGTPKGDPKGSLDVTAWDPEGRGKKGWTFTLPVTGEKAYAVLHTLFPAPIVLVASDLELLDRGVAAARSSRERLQWNNKNSAPDYLIARMPVGSKKAMTTVNLAWVEDKSSAHLQINTDYLRARSNTDAPKFLELGAVPLLGNGELALVFGADIPFISRVMMPEAPDPAAEIMQVAQILTGMDREQLEEGAKLLRTSRLSAVVTLPPHSEDKMMEHGAAYLVLESKEKEALQKIAKSIGANFTPVTLDGWNWMYKREMRGVPTALLGSKGGLILLGLARPESLAVKATIPDQLGDFSAPKDLVSLIVTMKNPLSREFLLSLLSSLYPSSGESAALFSDVDGSIHLRVITPEKADIAFYWEN